MGNNICQCKIICQNVKETDLSSSRNLTHIKYIKNLNKENPDLIKSNEEIQRIYLNNCVKKIARVYLIYKDNKNKKIKNVNKNNKNDLSNILNKEETNINSDLQLNSIDSFFDYSMTHLFNIDKVHSSKTSYKKFYIPKINNGKSLEMLLI